MAYDNTVKFIILSVLLIIIAFAIGMVWNVDRTSAKQRRLQMCADYQEAVVEGRAAASSSPCNGK